MHRDCENVFAVVLAAGSSRRLGSPKQLLAWRGRTLLERVLDNICSLLPGRVIVVLGAAAEKVQEKVALDHVQTLFNPDWQTGIASSIRIAIESLPSNAEAVLLLLVDQPLIDRQAIEKLLDQWLLDPSRIVVSEYSNTVGVPAVFPSPLFGALRCLAGDRGAKSLMLQFPQKLKKIPLPEAELDIDTREDFDDLIGPRCRE